MVALVLVVYKLAIKPCSQNGGGGIVLNRTACGAILYVQSMVRMVA